MGPYMKESSPARFLRGRPAQILTAFFAIQAGAFYGFSREESVPASRPLAEFPQQFGGWQLYQEGVVEQEIRDVLKADDLLSRTYVSPNQPLPSTLFIAFFRSQRTGQVPHSPKNCLPGNGWVSSVVDQISIGVADRPAPIEVNRFVVAKGDNQMVSIYWYHSRARVVASEYTAKFYVIADALRYNRTDTALVRVIVPVQQKDVAQATKVGVDFVKGVFPHLSQFLPQ